VAAALVWRFAQYTEYTLYLTTADPEPSQASEVQQGAS
jgi:hypothetical protein